MFLEIISKPACCRDSSAARRGCAVRGKGKLVRIYIILDIRARGNRPPKEGKGKHEPQYQATFTIPACLKMVEIVGMSGYKLWAGRLVDPRILLPRSDAWSNFEGNRTLRRTLSLQNTFYRDLCKNIAWPCCHGYSLSFADQPRLNQVYGPCFVIFQPT